MSGLLETIGATVGNWRQQRAYKKEAERNSDLKDDAQARLDNLKSNRQDIINPFDDFEAFDFDNPYSNLSVATEDAEMKAEEADLALANTVDTMRATGQSAGGATALANAALRSKRQVAASIEQQEAQNQKLMAQGEQQRQRLTASEEARVQQGQALGKQFMFNAEETRQFRDESQEISDRNYYRDLEDKNRAMKVAGVGQNTAQTIVGAGKLAGEISPVIGDFTG